MSVGDLDAYMEGTALEAYTARTITEAGRLDACLNEVRGDGFTTDLEEFAEGFCCVAASIHGRSGDVEATVGISVPSRRFRVEGRSIASLVLQVGQEASVLRGHVSRV